MKIIDAHLHLWNLQQLRLPWLAGESATLNRTYTLEDYLDAGGNAMEQAVYIEVDAAKEDKDQENLYAAGYCRSADTPINGAVISGALDRMDFPSYLAHYSGSWLKGVRHVLHVPSSPPGACLAPVFIKNVQHLGEVGLHFEACLRCEELGDLVRLAQHCPGTQILLNHMGIVNPDIIAKQEPTATERAYRGRWVENLLALSELPNLACKISGLNPAGEWSPESLRPAVDIALDMFGEDRVMFGSNYPVCNSSTGLRPWLEALQAITAERGQAFQEKLFAENARRIYRLAGKTAARA